MAAANTHGTSNGTTDVTVISAPGASTSRLIPRGGITIYNNDTASATIYLQFHDDSPTDVLLEKITLAAGNTYTLSMPLVLDATNETIEIYLAGAVATNELTWFAHYLDAEQ